MTIRPSTEEDVPSIVELLKLSLGETLMPKSVSFWKWKHLFNPFGPSRVLLAFEKEKLVGVRAFMHWEWRHRDMIFKSVRAVDTATHPEFYGKGIFKILTLSLTEKCENEGVNFIFNTPNKMSMPGYLKMGWQKNGRMKIWVRPLLQFGDGDKNFEPTEFANNHELQNLLNFPSNHLVTNRSVEFLNWRYTQNPNFKYYQFNNPDGIGIYRLKPNRLGIEFRITELFWNGKNKYEFNQHIIETAKASGANVITFSGQAFPITSLLLSIGPVITIRQLNGENSLSFGFWKPTLGDMELF
jgi:GNAT superfamily N-acetyltransferase